MISLQHHDLYWITKRLPKPVSDLMMGKTVPGRFPFLAGGFIRAVIAHEEPQDVDLFVKNKEDGRYLATMLQAKVPGGQGRLIETQNAITVYGHGIPVQFITRWTYETARDVLPSFDFSIAQAAIWYEPDGIGTGGAWFSECSDRFYADLAAKRLVYLHPIRNEDAGGSLLRLLKFYRRGYTAPLDSIAGVIARLQSGVRPEAGPLAGKELAQVLTGLLREVDPLLDPLHVFHAPSEADMAAEAQAIKSNPAISLNF